MILRELFFIYLQILIGLPYCISEIPKIPKNLNRCHRKAPIDEFNECMRKAIEMGHRELFKGNPLINVEQFDPLSVPEIRAERTSGPVSIKIIQKNIKLTGLANAQVKKIKANFDKNTLYGEYYVPRLVQIGDQSLDGRILVFPITGTGKANFTTLGYRANFTGNFKEYEKDGYHYWKFDEKSFRFKVMKINRMIFRFDNLFNGDKTLGEAMNRVLNQNWKVLVNEINPTSESVFGEILCNALNKFFGTVPLEEIFLD